MRLLLLSLLAITATVHARIPTLGPARDVNDAVNLSQFVLVSWDGNTLVGIDETKRRLIRCGYDTPQYALSAPPVVLMENLPFDHQLLAAELDAHPGLEVVLLAGNRCHLWSSGSRSATAATPDISFDLPAIRREIRSPAVIADFDGDGIADLLLPATGHLLFSFGTAGTTVVALPDLPADRITTAAPWRAGGPPVIALESSASGITTVIEYQTNRSQKTVEVFEGADTLVDLDGSAPPERVRSESSYSARTLVVRQKAGETWTTAATLPFPAGNAFFDGPAATADFDQNGRQELILTAVSDEISSEPPVTCVWRISSEEGPTATALTKLASSSVRPTKIEAVWMPAAGRFGLAQFHPSRAFYDALGNGVNTWGTGIRAFLRTSLLNGNPSSLAPLTFQEIPIDLATPRLDNDSLPDLVIAGESGTAIHHTGPFYHPEGGEKTTVRTGATPGGMETADFDGDGISDSLFVKGNSLAFLKTLRPAGESIGFSGPSSSEVFRSTNSPAPNRLLGTADFDGDGDMDALVLNGSDESLAWSPNNGHGSFGALRRIALAGREYRTDPLTGAGSYQWIDRPQTVIVDADNDGDPDIITLPSALGMRLALHRNQAGTFALEPYGPELNQLPGASHFFIQATDCSLHWGKFLSSDEGDQIAVLAPGGDGLSGSTTKAFIFRGAPGPLTVLDSIPLSLSAVATTVDFDSDGIDDFITASGPETDALGNVVGGPAIRFHRNRGNGTVDPPTLLAAPTGFTSHLEAVDLNGDGKPDLIAASKETGNVDVYLQQGVEPLPAYQDWISRFDVADAAPHADPDHDGIANLLEYASGTAPGPLRPSATLPTAAPVAPGIRFPYPWLGEAVHARPRQPVGRPLDIGVEVSADLTNWLPVDTPASISSDHEAPEWEVLRWEFLLPGHDMREPRFYRFKVTTED